MARWLFGMCRDEPITGRKRTGDAAGHRLAIACWAVALAAVQACGEADDSGPPSAHPGAGTTTSSPPTRAPYRDVTDEAGLDFVNFNGMTGEKYFVEMMGGGGALLDYDGDGDLDLYLVQGHELPKPPDSPHRDRLYRNDLEVAANGGTRGPRFTDVTERSDIDARGYGVAVATGDYDNDGRVDLYVANWGENQLWRNNGDGTFADVTAETGTGDPGWSAGAAFVDYDRDGWLDLFVVNYVEYSLETDRPCYGPSGRRDYCAPDPYPPARDRLYRNRGDGTFEDVSLRTGIAAVPGQGLGVATGDFDGDGWPDIYVANDRQENALWMNREGRRFENRAALAGTAVNAGGMAEASMGAVAADFDGDGDDDLFVTHLRNETNTLYTNSGDGLFDDRTRGSGLGLASRPFTGFGVAPIDYDNDGWLDLFIANGEVQGLPDQVERGDSLPLRQRNQLYRNLGNGRFRELARAGDPALERAEVSRGVAYGDIDNDGDDDLLIYNSGGPARLLLNEVGGDRPWVGLRLVGASGRDMIGARLEIRRSDGPTLWRRVSTSGSYASAHDPRVRAGLAGGSTIGDVRVIWPAGRVEVRLGLDPGRYHVLVQGRGERVARAGTGLDDTARGPAGR